MERFGLLCAQDVDQGISRFICMYMYCYATIPGFMKIKHGKFLSIRMSTQRENIVQYNGLSSNFGGVGDSSCGHWQSYYFNIAATSIFESTLNCGIVNLAAKGHTG